MEIVPDHDALHILLVMGKTAVGESGFPVNVQPIDEDVAGRVNTNAVHISSHKSLSPARTLVVNATLVSGLFAHRQVHIVHINMVNFVLSVATDETTVLACGRDVEESDAGNLSTTSFNLPFRETPVGIFVISVCTRIARHINRFSLPPPHVRPQTAIHLDIRERDVCDRPFIAVLYAQPSVGSRDDAVVEKNVADAVHILASNLDGTRTRGHHTIRDGDVAAGAVLLELAPILQADAVVAAGDMTICDANVL